MASVNQTRSHCVNKWERHSKPLAARHDRGTAWAWHVMCESAFICRNAEMFIVTSVKTSHLVFWDGCSREFTRLMTKAWKYSVTKEAYAWIRTLGRAINTLHVGRYVMLISVHRECKHVYSVQQFDRKACVFVSFGSFQRGQKVSLYMYVFIPWFQWCWEFDPNVFFYNDHSCKWTMTCCIS